MFRNPFKKKTPEPIESKPVSLLGTLGVLTPYRTQDVKAQLPIKNKIKKPYKMPAIGYALIAFASCIMAGVSSDAVAFYLPKATATPTAVCLAFMCLTFFCGIQANQKWKH